MQMSDAICFWQGEALCRGEVIYDTAGNAYRICKQCYCVIRVTEHAIPHTCIRFIPKEHAGETVYRVANGEDKAIVLTADYDESKEPLLFTRSFTIRESLPDGCYSAAMNYCGCRP